MLKISIDPRPLAELGRKIEQIEARLLGAIANGLNEGGDKVRTQVRAAMKRQTGLIQLKSVTSRQRTARAYASGLAPKSGIGPSRGAGLAYDIIFQGRPATRPREFAWRVQKGPGGGVTVTMWNVPHRFPRSFMIAGEGVDGLRMRKDKPRFPIRGFDGPNLAKEAAKEDGLVATTFINMSGSLVPPIIAKHIAKAFAR